MGRPSYQPDEKTREQVFMWAKYGVPVSDMALMMKISKPTVHKHFQDEIDAGLSHAHTKVRQTLWEMAVSGQFPAMTIFYAKTQLGYRETDTKDTAPAEIKITGGLPD
jgi:hypothetical protein